VTTKTSEELINTNSSKLSGTILDMEEEDDSPIILGRTFLNTTNAVIYVGSG
jgi:hypothetical protein